MKKRLVMIINLLPIVYYIVSFYMSYKNAIPDNYIGFIITVFLFFVSPVIFTLFNANFSDTAERFALQNTVYGFSKIIGQFLDFVLYHDYISNDSESEMLSEIGLLFTVIYILILTLVFYAIKRSDIKHRENRK
ncbi:MAG: hypothetical protein J5590_01945 [Clostridia bacterium]|nr:hypothetical protein [Clostridia bacterium]